MVQPPTSDETLRKKVYVGLVESHSLDKPVRGLHRPIVSEELFARVQDVLDGRKIKAVVKRRHNSAFPLKSFVRCEVCGQTKIFLSLAGKIQQTLANRSGDVRNRLRQRSDSRYGRITLATRQTLA